MKWLQFTFSHPPSPELSKLRWPAHRSTGMKTKFILLYCEYILGKAYYAFTTIKKNGN